MNTYIDYLLKILLVGDNQTGKTSLFRRFTSNTFDPEYLSLKLRYKATIVVNYAYHNMLSKRKVYQLQLWDTAGMERFKNYVCSYFRGSEGVILVYSIADRKSFQNVRGWYEQVLRYTKKRPYVLLVGNKSDL